MFRKKTNTDEQENEKESLISGKTNLYGNDDDDNNNDNYRWRNRTPSLSDTHDQKFNFKRNPSRLEWAQSTWKGWIEVLFWGWLNPLLTLGYKHTLTDADLDDLPHQDKSSVLLKKLLIYDWSKSKTWKIVLKAFGKETFYIGLLLLPQTAVRLCQPLFLRAIVEQVNHKNNISSHIRAGILLAIGFFLCSLLQALLFQHGTFLSTKLGRRIRNALSSIIYRHLLSINMSSLQQRTAAETINLVANDASKFEDLWVHIHFLWIGPLEAIISFSLLSWIIGFLPTTFAFLVILLLIPVQSVFSQYFTRYHQRTIICTDKRIKTYSELLDGCQIIKMYNWEKPMEKRLKRMRDDEISSIHQASHLKALNNAFFFISPCLISLAAFGGLWFLGFPLESADIFTALAFFGQLRASLFNLMPLGVERLSAVFVASQRIDRFMRLKTTQSQKRQKRNSDDKDNKYKSGTILMNDASFSWEDNSFCLSTLNIDIKTGQLVGIIGPVGAGKSSLLAAILGEMNLINGNINVNGSLSYAVQSTWIFADTIRANILLGKVFNQERYKRVLNACCLDIDLAAFGPSGDLTIIGEKGVNLSGGQKARVSLARALYIDADIYLLDDPLSAVDPKVAKRIFDNCIGPEGLLKEKTRLLVTHQTHFLKSSDQCIILSNGRIDKIGQFDQLSIANQHVNIIRTDTKTDKQGESTDEITAAELDINKSVIDTKSILRDEISSSGDVSWTVWARLFTAPPLGWFGLISLITVFIAGEVFYDVTIFWLAVWSRKSYNVQQHVSSFAYIYFGLTFATIITGILRSDYWFYIMIRGSAYIHNCMLKSILYTSMRFFESNSVGRILNRASRDQYLVDELLPTTMLDAVQALSIVAGSLTIIILVNPIVLILLIMVIPICWYLRRYYLRLDRQLKRLESVTRSPLYALFSSSLNGLTTIRVFKVKDDFVQTFIDRIDANTRSYLPLLSGTKWFGLRLDFISSSFVLMTAVVAIIMGHKMDAALVALSLSCSLNLVGRFQWGMRQLSEAENLMISAERIDEYGQLPPEEDNGGDKGLIQTSSDWPNNGSIDFQNYTLRYRLELEPVLNNLNLSIKPNEKIGIIGRTG